MVQRILILGGMGQVGRRVAQDLLVWGLGRVTLSGRQAMGQILRRSPAEDPLFADENVTCLPLDMADLSGLRQAIANHDLVIHCAGAFHLRDGRVLKLCIELGKNYLDVSDHRCLYEKIKPLRAAAEAAEITAICNAGVFPGISNSMVRLGVEQLETVAQIELYYGVAGSGGAGQTVLTTTFLGLTEPFTVWQDGQWQLKQPYSEPQPIDFPEPIGKANVYWFDVAETFTFAESFPVRTVITKFGSVPDIYNQLTRAMTFLPFGLLKNPRVINGLAKISYGMTQMTDRFTGVGVAMRAVITGQKDGKSAQVMVEMVHDHTAIAAGQGVGIVAELLLTNRITQKGLYPVEQIIPSHLFMEMAAKRGIQLSVKLMNPSINCNS